jgi:hypothetical protein
MNRSRLSSVLVPVGISVLTFVALLAAVRYAGLFTKSNGVATASVAGAFVTAMVTLVGILTKQGVDERAETRLHLEAGISAVELFAGPEGQPSLAIQRAGALIILSSLGHHKLTLALGTFMLPSGELDPATAARVLGEALETGDDSIRRYAINLFVSRAPCLLTASGYEVPEPILDGCRGYPPYIRLWSAIGMVRLLTSREVDSWRNGHRFSLNAAIVSLALLWQNEWDRPGRRNLAAIVRATLELVPDLSGKLGHHKRIIDVAKVRRATAGAEASGPLVTAAVEALKLLGVGGATGMAEVFGASGCDGLGSPP